MSAGGLTIGTEEKQAGKNEVHAQRSGEAEAEAADLRLRLKESLARERRLMDKSLDAEERLEDALRNEHELRAQIERYAAFNRDVERSAAWRLVQFLRRFVGRRW